MSISTFNFQFYNYKLSPSSPDFGSPGASRSSSSFISELEMDIDEVMSTRQPPTITSTPKPRYTTQLAVELAKAEQPGNGIAPLRPKLHTPQKRWSMELREKVLEMSKRNNGQEKPQTTGQQEQHEPLQQEQQPEQKQHPEPEQQPTVTDKINFFNKLTNTFESGFNKLLQPGGATNNRFIAMLRSSRPQSIATTTANSSTANSFLGSSGSLNGGQVPPPKPKRLAATNAQFATPLAPGMGVGKGGIQRKSSLRRKPSMDKSRATILRQNINVAVRPQNHAIMEDLSLVVPVRLRIAEYEQRISMSA
ncbi:protein bottleneck [Drosophila biarmipes]|uniref:protein bottleneck n=1 Tax=Drosophila biarmipes TaxID=125945 RepID=UPI0007E84EF2|nr:protein bottleneck [Drosophila biarmipes]